jgi:hypothetical protein
MTAVEEYTAHHSESLHTIMYEWGWATFEGMFRRHLLRKAREELRQMRDLRLAALDANMNYDSQENANAKQQRIDGLQDAFRQAEQALYSDSPAQDADTVAMENDPLFAPINQRARELRSQADQPLVEQAGMGRQLLGAT